MNPPPYSHLYADLCSARGEDRQNILSILLPTSEHATESKLSEIKSKLGKGILLDNPETKRLSKNKRNTKRVGFHIPRSSERKRLTSPIIPGEAVSPGVVSYGQFAGLHKLWEGYMRDLFSSMPSNELGQTLSRADYHGAIFNVYQSRCPSYVGIQGIMIQETLNTFVLIRNNDSRFATIPKKGTIFSVYLRLNPETQDTTEWQLCGDQLIGHSGLRSAKKFKSRGAVNL